MGVVAERREELTTEGGLEVQLNKENLKKFVRLCKDADITVSLVINPDVDQMKAAQWVEADYIEVHAGAFCEARTLTERQEEFERIHNAVKLAHKVGFGVNVGHRLDHSNIGWLVDLAEIEEFVIGHAIVARAVLVGFERAVREMLELINWGSGWRRIGP